MGMKRCAIIILTKVFYKEYELQFGKTKEDCKATIRKIGIC